MVKFKKQLQEVKLKRYNILFLEVGFARGGSSNFLYHRIKLINQKLFNPVIAFYYKNEGPDLKKLKQLSITILSLVSLSNWYHNLDALESTEANKFLLYQLENKIKIIRKTIYEFLIHIELLIKILNTIHFYNIHLVVLNNDIHYHLPGILAAKICQRPCICRKAGIGNGGIITRLLVPLVDLIFAISKAAEKDALSHGAKPKRLIRMYEGISLLDYQPEKFQNKKLEIRARFNISRDAIVIGTISRIAPTKGQEQLLKAASFLLQKQDNLVFLIVGDDQHPSQRFLKILKKQVETLRLGEKVKFIGWYENIPEILAVIDICVQNPSYPEGLGISALEAMAMAKPTVVTNMGGLAETILNNETGIIVSEGTPEQLAGALWELLKDKKRALAMGLNGRKRIEAKFDLAKNIQRIDDIFYNVIRN